MANYKAGLHKKLTSIFDGVPIPGNNDAQETNHAPAQDHPGHIPPRPAAPAPKVPDPPEPSQPAQSQPKTATAEQPKADTRSKQTLQSLWEKAYNQIKNRFFPENSSPDNKRRKAMVLIVPILSIGFIIVLLRAFGPTLNKTQASESAASPNARPASDFDVEIDWQIPELYSTTLRDPMQYSSLTAGRGTPKLIIRGILYSGDNPAASIDGQIVHEGEKVSGVTVVKINKNCVELEINGKRWTQKMEQ